MTGGDAGSSGFRIGLMLASGVPPERTLASARQVEADGFTELWVSEDVMRRGAFSTAAAVLASTEKLEVGIGVVSLRMRVAELLAMEVATLGAMFPGRFTLGVGVGAPYALRELGLDPGSPAETLRQGLARLRTLLEPEETEIDAGRPQLAYRPRVTVPIYVGASGPTLTRIASRSADGILLPVMSGEGHVRAAARAIQGASGRRMDNVVLCYCAVAEDAQSAGSACAEYFLSLPRERLTSKSMRSSRLFPQIESALQEQQFRFPASLLQACVDEFFVSGTPLECAQKVSELRTAGARAVMLAPLPGAPVDPVIAALPAIASALSL